jgi:hypothetical protein
MLQSVFLREDAVHPHKRGEIAVFSEEKARAKERIFRDVIVGTFGIDADALATAKRRRV